MKAGMMRLFIVEDSVVMRENLQIMLSGIPGITIIGYAADEQSAIERIDSLLPDVAILDISLQSSGSGISVLENIKKHHSAIKVIMLTNHAANEFYINRCKHAGADYFFDKSFQIAQVYSTLRAMSLCRPHG